MSERRAEGFPHVPRRGGKTLLYHSGNGEIIELPFDDARLRLAPSGAGLLVRPGLADQPASEHLHWI